MQTPAFPFPLPARQQGSLAITHVTVLPMDEEREIPDHTVVLRDGTIEAPGPAHSLMIEGMCFLLLKRTVPPQQHRNGMCV